jgi:signal transduction histidine kinase
MPLSRFRRPALNEVPLRAPEAAAHMCCLYNTPEEYLQVLREFVEVGIVRGEKCLCLVARDSEESFRGILRSASAQIASAVQARAVDVTTLDVAYHLYEEHFLSHVLDFWSATTEEALAAGFSGLRGVIRADRALGGAAELARWSDYESRLTGMLMESRGMMLCLYHRPAHPAEFLREALRAHATVAHRGVLGENMFHVPPSEYGAPDRARREVDRMLDCLYENWGQHLTQYVDTVEDVTDRGDGEESLSNVQAELARASRAITLGQLMVSIAHEVNQPLAAVIANAGAGLRWLAGEQPRIGPARQALIRIVRDGNRASEVITRIRALVRKADIERKPLDLNRVIGEVIALLRMELRRNKVTVRTGLAVSLPSIWGDKVQLQQVLLNLIMNAIESMSAVETRSRLLSITTTSDDNGVSVSVKDRGVGLDQEVLERVFEPFYTTKPHGMGIGLAISRSIVETHGGVLWAHCNRGPGTTFKLRLPTVKANVE